MTQEPQPPYPHQPPPPGTWAQPGGQQPQWGAPAGPPALPQQYGQPYPPAYGSYPPVPPQPPVVSGMYQAAAIVNWIVLGLLVVGTCGFGIIAAAWYVPMTMAIQRGSRDRYKHTTLAVCTLLFCNLVSGVLMLVEDGNRQQQPYA